MAIHTIRGIEHQPAPAQGRRVAYITAGGIAVPAPRVEQRTRSTVSPSQSQAPSSGMTVVNGNLVPKATAAPVANRNEEKKGKTSYFQAFMSWFWSLFSLCCPSKKA